MSIDKHLRFCIVLTRIEFPAESFDWPSQKSFLKVKRYHESVHFLFASSYRSRASLAACWIFFPGMAYWCCERRSFMASQAFCVNFKVYVEWSNRPKLRMSVFGPFLWKNFNAVLHRFWNFVRIMSFIDHLFTDRFAYNFAALLELVQEMVCCLRIIRCFAV